MRRVSILLPFLAVVLAGSAALGRISPHAGAQDATPAATHPVVGSWLADTDVDDPANPPSLLAVHADGTYVEVDTDGVGIGAWEATGERTVNLTIVYVDAGEDGAVVTVTVRASIEVAEDGQSFTADYTLEFAGIEGMPAGEIGPGRATGTRIAVEPMGTPGASFEEAFGAFEASPEATPAG